MIKFLVFMCLWILGCFIADEFLTDIPRSYMMLFGYTVGSCSLIVGEIAKDKYKSRKCKSLRSGM